MKANPEYVAYLKDPKKRSPPAHALPRTGRELKDAVEQAYNLPKGCLDVKGCKARTAFKAALFEAAVRTNTNVE